MTRPIVLGNGNILACLDNNAQIRDFYYPHIGQEDHVGGNKHRIGIWVNGRFSWLENRNEWEILIRYKPETMVSEITAINRDLGIELTMNDAVHYKDNIFLRKINVKSLDNVEKEIKIFFNQHFHISGADIGDTVYYNPFIKSMINYKGKVYFLINGQYNKKGFDDYATGEAHEHGKAGTYVDAEDGILSKNNIEHGSVDSTISFHLSLKPDKKKTVYYWIAVGEKYSEIEHLHNKVLKETPEKLLKDTEKYWKTWVNKQPFHFLDLDKKVVSLFKRSLLIIKSQTDDHGAIIAANDSDIKYFKKDTYSYMWPRDGALVARAFDKAGYNDTTQRFFEFCNRVLTTDGYLFHKYRADGSLGSSWHPWLYHDHIQLPIQEDQTALILDALWKRYDQFGDKKFAKEMYGHLIKKSADFMVGFRDKETGLPSESYDLWEEKLGMSTFTCSTVYAGLKAASKFAKIFGTKKDSKRYDKAAEEIKGAILKYLYDEGEGHFIKGIFRENGELVRDKTLDSSSGYGIFEFNVLEIGDERVVNTMNAIKSRLTCPTSVGGIMRYTGDRYHKTSENSPSNPWFISTLWLAEYYIAKANNQEELKPAIEIFNWVERKAMPSGVLSEQIHPYTGEPLSVAPLTWSHGAYVTALIKYLDKLEKLGLCKANVFYPLKKVKVSK